MLANMGEIYRSILLAEIVMESILVAFENCQLNPFVNPKAIEGGQALGRHRVLDADFGIS